MNASPLRLFVYGTLQSNSVRPLATAFGADGGLRLLGSATAPGALFLCAAGWYPGFVYDAASDSRVVGEVYEAAPSLGEAERAVLLRRLDEYEGCSPSDAQPHEYRREEHDVVLVGDSRRLRAAIYVLNVPTESLHRIASGDFLQFARSQQPSYY